MFQLIHTAKEAAMAALILIPIFLLLNRFRFHSGKMTALFTLFAVYLTGVYGVVGLPNISYIRFDPNIQLMPFADMAGDWSGTVLNVILFVPLGIFLTLLWERFRRFSPILVTGFLFSLTIELLQMFTFRATDINDLMTNTLGALLGWCTGRLLCAAVPSLKLRSSRADFFLVIGSSFAVMFLFQPLIWAVIE